MRKYFVLLFLLGCMVILATSAWSIRGWPRTLENLDVTASVTRITSTTYQPDGTGTNIKPCLVQTKGTGYYCLEPYASVAVTAFTPTATNGYTCINGDIIEVDHPQFFRIIRATTSFSAPCTSFEE